MSQSRVSPTNLSRAQPQSSGSVCVCVCVCVFACVRVLALCVLCVKGLDCSRKWALACGCFDGNKQ